jgi:hypothetical protein
MNLKQTVRKRTSTSETCIGELVFLGRVTSPELIAGVVKNEMGDLVADYRIILVRRGVISQLLNVQGVNDARKTEIHIAEPLVPNLSVFEVEMAI